MFQRQRTHASPICRWFRSVVVITSALHAEGPRFDPGRNQFFFITIFVIITLLATLNITG